MWTRTTGYLPLKPGVFVWTLFAGQTLRWISVFRPALRFLFFVIPNPNSKSIAAQHVSVTQGFDSVFKVLKLLVQIPDRLAEIRQPLGEQLRRRVLGRSGDLTEFVRRGYGPCC
jgi:hypothetical protein